MSNIARVQHDHLQFADRRVWLIKSFSDVAPERVIYLLDGDAALSVLEPEWLRLRPGLAVVAIGYEATERFNLELRSRDYTPTPPPSWDGGSRNALARPYGGAERFLSTLVNQIMPSVEATLGMNAPHRALWGHSYGGLFTLWTLTQREHRISTFHAASPSLWWGDYDLEQTLLRGEMAGNAPRDVRLSLGEKEVSRTGEVLYSAERLERLRAVLEQRLTCSVTAKIFAGAGHGDTFALSLHDAIAES